MIKKNILSISLAIAILLTLLCMGCTEEEATIDFMSNSSCVYVDMKSSGVLSFDFILFSKEKVGQVDCIGIEGESVNNEDYDISLMKNVDNLLNDYQYKGLYMQIIRIDIKTKSSDIKSCEFERLLLNVDGTRREITFEHSIKNEFAPHNVFTDALQISVIPVEFLSSFINDEESRAEYSFLAEEDVTLNTIRFGNFLSYSSLTIHIDDVEQESNLPINIQKGQTIRILLSFMSDSADKFSTVMTNIFFDYTTVDGTNYYNSALLIFDPVYPIMDNDLSPINDLIDYLLSKS